MNQAIGEMEDGALDPKDIEELLGGVEFDSALNEKERLEVYKKLIDSLLRLREESGLSDSGADLSLSDILDLFSREGGGDLRSGKKLFPSIPETGEWGAELYSLTKKRKETLDFLRRFEDHEKNRSQIARDQVKVETESGIKYIPTEYYFRDSPYEEILAQGSRLFYIIRGFPDLGLVDKPHGHQRMDESNPGRFLEKGVRVIYVTGLAVPNSGVPEVKSTERQPFEFVEEKGEQIKLILDGLMSLPEEDQFVYFAEKYLDVYDPASRDMADLTNEFIYNNLSNVIIVIDSISTAFDFVEELYFSKPLDYLFLECWGKYPKTNTGFEFLFSLASHYDFERRALAYMIGAFREAKRLLNRSYFSSNVYNHRAKAYVIKEIFEDLFFQLREKGYKNLEQAIEKYREEQIRIYEQIIHWGGTAKNRAHLALGRLYWDEAQYDLAEQEWSRIYAGYSSKTYRAIRKILDQTSLAEERIHKIDELLGWEMQESSRNLLERLLKYHRWRKRGKRKKAIV